MICLIVLKIKHVQNFLVAFSIFASFNGSSLFLTKHKATIVSLNILRANLTFFTNISKFSVNSRFFSQTDHDPVDADLHAVAVSEGGHIDGREEVDDSRAARGEGDQLEGHVMMGDHRDQDLSQAAADESFTSIQFFFYFQK